MRWQSIPAGLIGLLALATKVTPAPPPPLPFLPLHYNDTAGTATDATLVRRGDLEARAHWKPEVECGEGSVTDDSVLIMEKYLRGQEGSPGNNPHQCGQVACYWGAYITWCNDGDEDMQLDNWGQIADAARLLIYKCKSKPPASMLSGKLSFPDEKWSVSIGGSHKFPRPC